MTDAKVNYTDEAVARLHEVYDGDASDEQRDAQVAQLAEELGKSAASVRAKLTREGIYVAKAKVEAGKRATTKAELVTKIAEAMNVDEDVVGSLEKTNKNVLNLVLKALSE